QRCTMAGIGKSRVARACEKNLRFFQEPEFQKDTLWVRMHVVTCHAVVRTQVVDTDGGFDVLKRRSAVAQKMAGPTVIAFKTGPESRDKLLICIPQLFDIAFVERLVAETRLAT